MTYRSFASALVVAIAFGSAGCGNSTGTSSGAGGTTSSGQTTTASTVAASGQTAAATTTSGQGTPTISMTVNPTTMAAGSTVQASVTVTNFNLVDPNTHMTDVAGQGHYHIYLDAQTNYLVAGQTPQIAVKIPAGTSAGAHTLRVSLSDNKHVALAPPVDETIDITVQ